VRSFGSCVTAGRFWVWRLGTPGITGELKERERKGALRRQVRRSGRFDYRLTLPGEVQADRIEASLDTGALTLRVPKVPRAQPRRIEVKAGG
jgi:HSP20 family protein